MDIKIRVKDYNKLRNDIIKELMPKSSKITVGVKDRPHFDRSALDWKEHSKGIKGISSVDTVKIATAHEYGIGVPRRSFVRDTIDRWLFKDVGSLAQKNYQRIGFFLKAISNKVYERIQEAFDTNGWGQWQDLSDKYMEETGRKNPALTDTGQLRGAIYVEYAGETISGKSISGVGPKAKAKRSDYGVKRKFSMAEYAATFWKSRRKF